MPKTLVDERVWARADGGELVAVHADSAGGQRMCIDRASVTPGAAAIGR